MRLNQISILAMLFCLPLAASAQSPVSGFMNGKGKGAVALSYTAEKYDEVLLVPANSDGVPVFNEVKLNSVSVYATYGISDKLDVVFNLPYITAKGDAPQGVLNELGYENERSGLQDVSVFLKYNPYSLDMGTSKLHFILGGGLKTPLGNYKVDEGLQSILAIGNRATSFTGLAIAQFRTESGFFIGTQAGYSLRSGDVPNAVVGEIKAGFGSKYVYVDAWFAGQVSDGGVNILAEGFQGIFPETDVSYTRAGLNIYVPIVAGIGVSGGISQYLDGRNVGKSTGFSGGVVCTF